MDIQEARKLLGKEYDQLPDEAVLALVELIKLLSEYVIKNPESDSNTISK